MWKTWPDRLICATHVKLPRSDNLNLYLLFIIIFNVENVMNKTCTKCGESKPRDEFYKRSGGRLLHSQCKVCMKSRNDPVYQKEYHAEYRDRLKEEMRFHTALGKSLIANQLWRGAKRRAEEKGLEFTITEQDIHVPDVCPILGIPLKVGDGVVHDESPTLDRISSDKGYVPGNIHVISHRANRVKSNATVDDLKKVFEWMKRS